MHTSFFTTFALGILALIVPFVAAAQISDPASFPSCLSPTGTVIVSYPDGVHGIAGDSGVYTGSDTVYALSEGNVLQCFCPTGGATGIQTNWLNASSLSSGDISSLVSSGWTYVVSGIAWGLSDHPFMTKNVSFTCAPSGGGEGSGGSGSSGSGGGPDDGGRVLGTSMKKAAVKTPVRVAQPAILGDEIMMLPAAGSNFLNILIALFVTYL